MFVRFMNDLYIFLKNIFNLIKFTFIKFPMHLSKFIFNIFKLIFKFLAFVFYPIKMMVTMPSRNIYYKRLKESIFNVEVLTNKTTY